MSSWTNATPATTPDGVILRRRSLDHAVDRLLAEPSGSLTDWVDTYWGFSWQTPQAVQSSLVPQFAVNLTFEDNTGRPGADSSVVLTGVPDTRFDVELTGSGHVIGVKFRPGTFTAVTGSDATSVTGRTVSGSDVLPASLIAAFTTIAGSPPVRGDSEQITALDDLVQSVVPDRVPDDCTRARTILQDAHLPYVTRVDHLAERHDMSVRTLQRLFERWVGLSPKSVITRLRLQDAIATFDEVATEPLADIAVRLGFYDQAHFTREFTRFIGVSPARYVAGLG